MSRLEGGLHGLKANPSARANDQDCRHGVMLPVGSTWLTVMCDAGSHTARWAGGLKRIPRALRSHAARLRKTGAMQLVTNSAQECLLRILAQTRAASAQRRPQYQPISL